MVRIFLVFVLLIGARAVEAQTINVPAQVATIQGAINAASSGAMILVAPGLYVEDIDFQGKGITLKSVADNSQTTIQGTGTGPVVTLTNTTMASVLDGFTITGGTTGLFFQGFSAPVVRNCVISGNHSVGLDGGGGIRLYADQGVTSSMILLDCIIKNNTSENGGGGIQVETGDAISNCALTMQRCEVVSNVAFGNNGDSSGCSAGGGACATRGGGGIHLFSRVVAGATGTASLTMSDCEINNNVAVHEGGGLFLESAGTVNITNSRIAENIAALAEGGGIAAFESSFFLENCFITNNSSGSMGGGIAIDSTFPFMGQINNATIAFNTASIGGGLRIAGAQFNLNAANSIIWGNNPLDYFRASGPSFFSHCNLGMGSVVTGPNNLSVDPRFCSPNVKDYHLTRGSVCVDAGDPFTIGQGTFDRDGTNRIVNGVIDMGADEVPAHPLLGSNEDLELHTWTTTGGDPNVASLALSPGEVLLLRLKSPGATFFGAGALIVGQAYPTGSPPLSPAGLPGVHLDGFGLQVVFGDASGAFLTGPTINLDGIILGYQVPVGFAGFSYRLQGFAVTAFAQNGAYAVTEAHDLVF